MKKRTILLTLSSLFLSTLTLAQTEISVVNNTKQHLLPTTSYLLEYNSEKANTLITLPYFETFDSQDAAESYTIIDGNKDNNSWTFTNGMAEYMEDMFNDNSGDDWLITPPFKLEAGKNYEFSLKAKAFDNETSECFESFLGTDTTVASMIIPLFQKTTVASSNFNTYTQTIKVPTTGTYRLGIHCISEPDKMTLNIDDISIKEGATDSAPKEVSSLTAIAAEGGDLRSFISFKAPTTTTAGTPLTKLDSITVVRGQNHLVSRLTNVAPGASYSITDEHPENGINTYTVIAYNAFGAGLSANTTVFIGVDIPLAPEQAKAENVGNDTHLSWTISNKGWNGEYVNPDSVKYTIYETSDGINRTLIAENHKGTELNIPLTNATGKQKQVAYQIYPMTIAGKGQKANTNTIIIGKTYELPFKESLPNQKTENSYWAADVSSKKVKILASNDAQDNDGGTFYLYSTIPNDTLSLQSGKISLSDAQAPTLSFYYKGDIGKGAKLSIGIGRNGILTQILKEVSFTTIDWQQAIVDLTSLKNEDYIQLFFNINFGVGAAKVFLDNIRIEKNGSATGISTVSPTTDASQPIFNISGVRVFPSEAQHGIYIIGGKKIYR